MSTGESKDAIARIKTALFALMVFLGVVCAGSALLSCTKSSTPKIIGRGDRAPEFRLLSSEGRAVRLSDYWGKVIMVHFWATWCPPCVEEIPTLETFYRRVLGSDIEVLAVSVDEAGADAVAAFMKKNGVHFPVLIDADHAVAGLYGTFKFPETYIIGRDGVVRYKVIGPQDWSVPVTIEAVQSLLSGT